MGAGTRACTHRLVPRPPYPLMGCPIKRALHQQARRVVECEASKANPEPTVPCQLLVGARLLTLVTSVRGHAPMNVLFFLPCVRCLAVWRGRFNDRRTPRVAAYSFSSHPMEFVDEGHLSIAVTICLSYPPALLRVSLLAAHAPPPLPGPTSNACPPFPFGGGGGCCRRQGPRAQPAGSAEPVSVAAAHPLGGAARHAACPGRPCTSRLGLPALTPLLAGANPRARASGRVDVHERPFFHGARTDRGRFPLRSCRVLFVPALGSAAAVREGRVQGAQGRATCAGRRVHEDVAGVLGAPGAVSGT